MPVQIRFRDGWEFVADFKAAGKTFEQLGRDMVTREQWDAVEPAAPGDIWRVHWYTAPGEPQPGPMAGYSICYTTCPHSGKGSCWSWSGSAEEGTLTAQPSLYCRADLSGCGYHGFLTNGILSDG